MWIVVALVVVPVVALSVYSVVDLVRRNDVAGGRKAAWIAAVAFLPLLGGVLYLIFRPSRPDDLRGFGRRHHQRRRARELLREGEDSTSEDLTP